MRKLLNAELGRPSVEEFKNLAKLKIVVVLDNIRSLNNIGSVFRTSDAFLLEAVYLCGITATPPHREIHKTALGATESMEWKYFPTTLEAVAELRSRGYRIMAVEQTDDSTMLQNFIPDPENGMAFIFGNEVNGVEEEVVALVDECIEIPQFGTKHSLNVAVSAGMVIWDVIRKMAL